MITHRALRDIQRCEEKYGEDWQEYKRRVPWLFIPVSVISPRYEGCGHVDRLTDACSTFSNSDNLTVRFLEYPSIL